MEEIRQTLLQLRSVLDTLSVTGYRSCAGIVACMNTLDRLAAKCEEESA